LHDEIIDDILTTAFEGGINYWSPFPVKVDSWPEGIEYASMAVSKGGVVQICEFTNEGDDGTPLDMKWHKINRFNMIHGINKAAEHFKLSVEGFWDEHDAGMADVAVQFAIFNEIIYG
jgi:hypothetical protein